jgi:hypothetical protein
MFTDSDIEIRPVVQAEDFGEALTPAMREQEEMLRTLVEKRAGDPSAT